MAITRTRLYDEEPLFNQTLRNIAEVNSASLVAFGITIDASVADLDSRVREIDFWFVSTDLDASADFSRNIDYSAEDLREVFKNGQSYQFKVPEKKGLIYYYETEPVIASTRCYLNIVGPKIEESVGLLLSVDTLEIS